MSKLIFENDANAWPWLEKSKVCKGRLNFCLWGQFDIKIFKVRLMNTTYFICIFLKKNELEPDIIWKVATCQRITSKKHSNSVGRYLSPRYGQAILVSRYTVLTAVNWSKHQYTISGCRLPNEPGSMKLNIGIPVVRTDGRSGGRFTVTWLANVSKLRGSAQNIELGPWSNKI